MKRICNNSLHKKVQTCVFHSMNQSFRAMSTAKPLPHVTVNKSRKEAEVILPGYSYGDLDRVGNVKIWKVPLLSEAARLSIYCNGDPTPPAMLTMLEKLGGKAIFLGAARYEIMPEFYDRSHYYNPLRFLYRLPKMGRSSYQQYLEAYSTTTHKLLHKDSIFNVMVDIEARRPVVLLDEFKSEFVSRVVDVDDRDVLESIIPLIRPTENVHHVAYNVHWSNSDYYYHSNQSQYLKFVHDALSVLTNDGGDDKGLQWFDGDIAWERLKCVETVYKGETRPGDNLDIYVWENPATEKQLGCEVEKNGHVVFQCSMQFY